MDLNVAFCVVTSQGDFDREPNVSSHDTNRVENEGALSITDVTFPTKVYFYPSKRRKFINEEFLPLVSTGARVLVKESQFKSACILTRETGSRFFAHSLVYCTPLAKSPQFGQLNCSANYNDLSCGLYEQKCITIVSQYALHAFMSRCLDVIAFEMKTSSSAFSDFSSSESADGTPSDHASALVAPKIVSRLLLPIQCHYSSWIVFKNSALIAAFYLPNCKSQLPLLNLSIKQCLFDEVGLDNSVSILTCCMTEKYVLFKSQHPAKLVPAAEALMGLLYPFQWQLAYVPHLPAAHMEFLEMPQPYIIGVSVHDTTYILQTDAMAVEDNINKALFCVVDLDSGLINWPEDQTPLPDKRRLITNIQNRLTLYYTGNHEFKCEFSEDVQTLLMNQIIRETVLEYMLKLISGYNSYTTATQGTDGSHFDHMAFLSERASSEESKFLSDFVQTQMFVSFLDQMRSSKRGGRFYSVFKSRLEKPLAHDDKSFVQFCVDEVNALMRLSNAQTVVQCNTPDDLPKLNNQMENLHLIIPEAGSEFHPPSLKSPKSTSTSPGTPKDATPKSPNNNNLFPAISPSIHAPADISAFNFKNPKKIIDELLDECKTKTKKLLLVKLGREVENLGIQESVSLQEENTLIKSLCDLMDRIWSHGLAIKKGHSPLWSHLVEFGKRQMLLSTPSRNSKTSISTAGSLPVSPNAVRTEPRMAQTPTAGGRHPSSQLSISTPLQTFKIKFYQQNLMQSIRIVQSMSELKTEASKVRAWIRLAIERKVLASHIKELLADEVLLRQLYRPNSFFLFDDQEFSHIDTITQLTYHLLTLNAVDFFSFTDNFPVCKVAYKLHVCPIPRINSNRIYIVITGSLNQSGKLILHSDNNELPFKCDNLGRLLTVRIGCEGQCKTANWFMDTLLVRNSLTGHIWKFPCAQWIGLGSDESSLGLPTDSGSNTPQYASTPTWGEAFRALDARATKSVAVERLLFAELLSRNLKESDIPNVVRSKSPATPMRSRRNFLPNSSRATTPGSTLTSPVTFSVSSFRRSSLTRLTENLTVFSKPKLSKLQESLGNAVNDLVKALHYYQQNDLSVAAVANQKSPQQTSGLSRFYNNRCSGAEARSPVSPMAASGLTGPNFSPVGAAANLRAATGLTEIPVDELTKLVCGPGGLMNALLQVFHFGLKSPAMFRSVHAWDYLIAFKDELAGKAQLSPIESDVAMATSRFNSTLFAKDLKFHILACFALRAHKLHLWVDCLCASETTLKMYESNSFFRDDSLKPYFVNLLRTLAPYNFDQLSKTILRNV